MSYKKIGIKAELVDELAKRLPTMVITESQDSDGNPMVTVSQDATPVAGEKVIVLRVRPITWSLAKDVLGLPSVVHTPHVIDICTEANNAAGAVADILTPVELLAVLGTVTKRGTRVEWYQSANLTVPSLAQMIAANLKASYEPEIYWGSLSSQ